ncbi:MAG: hypothetical protein GY847_37155 [Proteobacteria bacterium]|nr:hypothetical protein [Pseudomonadota bacterium]
MKKLVLGVIVTILFAAAIVVGNPIINKKHSDKAGKDKAKVNCVYCHKKAAIPKKKGQDSAKLLKGEYCAIKGCHS